MDPGQSKDSYQLSMAVEHEVHIVRQGAPLERGGDMHPAGGGDVRPTVGGDMRPTNCTAPQYPEPDPPPHFRDQPGISDPLLSPELLEMIIDYIQDKRDLRACCLAGRLLLPRSRSHLHRRLHLKPRTNVQHYEDIYTAEWPRGYVKEVEILGCLTPNAYTGDDANSGLNEEGDPDHRWLDHVVPLLRKLPSTQVTWLDLRDLSWGDISAGTRHFLLSHFNQARRLSLSAIDFWNSNQMFRTLSAFPRIYGLSMENLSWHRANHARRQLEYTADMRLRYLHIGQTEFARYGPFVKWLLGKREVVTVDEAFVVWEDTEIMSLILLLRRLVPSLKGLIYQQCMVMPGSEVVDARLAAAAVVAPIPPAAPITPLPVLPVQDPPIAQAPGATAVGIEPMNQVDDHQAGEVDADMQFESDEEGEEDAIDEDGDGMVQASGPPIEMADDEHEEEGLIEESVAENLHFPRERDALREGMEVLNGMPLEDSVVERLNARIAWSSLAVFGIKLMSQVFTAHCKTFNLLLTLPPMAQWERVDWLSIDSILDDVAQRATKNATLEISFLGAFVRKEAEVPSICAGIATRLPLLVARKRWTARYDNRYSLV